MLTRFRSFTLAFLAAGFFALVSTSASAQLMHDSWFKVKASASGYAMNKSTGALIKGSISRVAYLHFRSISAPAVLPGTNVQTMAYDIDVWTEVSKGVFAKTYTTSETFLGPRENIVNHLYLRFDRPDGYFGGFMTAYVSIKLDKLGHLKSASIASLGGETIAGTIDGGKSFLIGSLKMKGSTIAASKLPF